MDLPLAAAPQQPSAPATPPEEPCDRIPSLAEETCERTEGFGRKDIWQGTERTGVAERTSEKLARFAEGASVEDCLFAQRNVKFQRRTSEKIQCLAEETSVRREHTTEGPSRKFAHWAEGRLKNIAWTAEGVLLEIAWWAAGTPERTSWRTVEMRVQCSQRKMMELLNLAHFDPLCEACLLPSLMIVKCPQPCGTDTYCLSLNFSAACTSSCFSAAVRVCLRSSITFLHARSNT
ncbi:uncharacterized protein LOC103886823 isoform X2 [Papio anubis]|uniref:uncharacterized protein LOC103886823 isoform X2 n=1 Tax=Papio anubis TaxID=9555 RepID=UPI0012ADD0B9|nr:uncharacterized protein LOC103886823 isoform X2 [Papio anubis]XP_021798037.2 uncharacterized protein LOC103886823 isoform X2 [Papio anubis]